MKQKIRRILTGGLVLFSLIITVLFSSFVVEAKNNLNVAMIIAPQKFADQEFFEPKAILEQHNVKITVASTTLDPAFGYGTQSVKPDLIISDIKADDYDAIIVVGGEGAIKFLWGNQELSQLVKDANEKNKIVAAICAAPVVLARAGILKGKSATCYPDSSTIGELQKGGANYIDQKVVVTGNLITGNGPASSTEFGLKIWDELVKL